MKAFVWCTNCISTDFVIRQIQNHITTDITVFKWQDWTEGHIKTRWEQLKQDHDLKLGSNAHEYPTKEHDQISWKTTFLKQLKQHVHDDEVCCWYRDDVYPTSKPDQEKIHRLAQDKSLLMLNTSVCASDLQQHKIRNKSQDTYNLFELNRRDNYFAKFSVDFQGIFIRADNLMHYLEGVNRIFDVSEVIRTDCHHVIHAGLARTSAKLKINNLIDSHVLHQSHAFKIQMNSSGALEIEKYQASKIVPVKQAILNRKNRAQEHAHE